MKSSADDNSYNGTDNHLNDEWNEQNDGSDEEPNQTDIEFPELENRIKEVLQNYSSVFPKLNWSSCEDSKWMSASGTRCRQSQDIYLLLKSSDRIVHDLTQPSVK